MSEEIALAAADLETVRQLRAALAVATDENTQRQALETQLQADALALRALLRDTIYRVEDVLEGAEIDDGIVHVSALTRLDQHYFGVLKPMRATEHPGAALLADAAALRAALTQAQADVCSLNCPSVWKTADGPPPHSEKCRAVSAALDTGAGASLLAELARVRSQADLVRQELEQERRATEAERAANRRAALEIARLREAMSHAARMLTIKGARKIIADAIGAEP